MPTPVYQRRLLVGMLAVGAVPGLLLLDTGIALVRGWRTASRLDIAVVSLAALILLCILGGLTIPRVRMLVRAWWARFVLLDLMALSGLVVAEAVLGLMWPLTSGSYHTRPPKTHTVFRPQPGMVPGVSGDSRWSTNVLGIRGPEFPPRNAAYRILCIGGSTTECLYLDDDETWPHLLGVALKEKVDRPQVWVGNIGKLGYSTLEHLRFVEESPLARSVDCLVFLVGVNDFLRPLRGDFAADGTAAPLWQRMTTMNLVRPGLRAKLDDIQVEDATGANYGRRRRARGRASILDELPDVDRALRAYESRVRAIIRHCDESGVRAVFLSQPVLWDKELSLNGRALLWMGWVRSGRYLSVEKLREGIDLYNEVLHIACDRAGAEFIDLTVMGGRVEFFYDDCHFNEAGAREVARLVSLWFSEHPRSAWRPKVVSLPGRGSP